MEGIPMNWFWINIPLAVAFLGLWTGIPIWLVIKHPDQRPTPASAPAAVTGLPAPAEPKVAVAAQQGELVDAVS
jgi:hypothetical protein